MDLFNSALQYLRAGIAVTPLHGVSQDGQWCHCPRGVECPSKGKHPIFKEWASHDFPSEELVRDWFVQHPTANLGGRTGAISGNIFVLDIDPGGREAFRPTVQANGGIPETLVHRTGRGGEHFFYRAPQGIVIPNSQSKLAPHVDVRGEGGQAVLPPSRTNHGVYLMAHPAPIADAPQWLVDLILSLKADSGDITPQAAPKRPQSADDAAKERNMLRKIIERLDEKKNKRWEPGDSWDITCFTEACHLVELGNSEWTASTHDQLYSLYMDHAPHDEKWDDRRKCWERAVIQVGTKAKAGPTPIGIEGMASGGGAAGSSGTPLTAQQVEDRVSGAVAGGQVGGADSAVVAHFCNDSLLNQAYYTDEAGWLAWDGRVWKRMPSVAIEERFRLWASEQVTKAVEAGNDAAVKLYSARLTTNKLKSIPERCRGAMLVDIDIFDRHPDLLNVRNGVVNLATGELMPHNPALMLTRITEVDYVPGATHPDWDTALEALPPRVVEWLQLRIGQAATGYPTWDDLLPICQGGGENGKSTFVASILHALGGYAGVISERVLLGRATDHPTEMTDLRGMRMALIEETPQESVLNIKRLKDVLGTSRIRARRMRENTVEWTPTHSLFLTTNYAPKVAETDHGTWRRLALVRFPYVYVKDGEPLTHPNDRRGDLGLRPRLEAGLEGQHQAVLAWIVQGAMRWYASNRAVAPLPPEVVADTAAWRAETDRIHGFLDEYIEFDPAGKVVSTDLYAEFSQYLTSVGAPHWAENTFAARLKEHPKIRDNRVVKRRTSALDDLSRPGATYQAFAPGQQAMVYFGMKFAPKERSRVTPISEWASVAN